MIWTPQNAARNDFALRMTLFAAALAAVAVGGWFLSTAAHSAAPGAAKCKCIPKKGLSLKSWKAGQGDRRSLTFIADEETEEETKCKLDAKVYYNDPSEWGIRPKSYTWEDTSMSHDFEFAKKSSVFWYYFILDADGTGPKHTPAGHPSNGRGDEPMEIKIRFLAIFECLPACAICPSSCPYASSYGKRVTYDLQQDLKQDEIDEMRQEYVDHGITVPSRGDFTALNEDYVDRPDDYAYMVGKGLSVFHAVWASRCQEKLREMSGDSDATVIFVDLIVNSGYRNPEHNRHHLGSKPGKPWSRHQYGIALDVRNIDLDGDGKVIREKDGPLMKEAAELAGAGYADWTKYNTITHADWR